MKNLKTIFLMSVSALIGFQVAYVLFDQKIFKVSREIRTIRSYSVPARYAKKIKGEWRKGE